VATGKEGSLAERIGIIGGTGRLGGALAARWAAAGLEVQISGFSKDPGMVASVLNRALPAGSVSIQGSTLEAIARDARVIVVCVPYGVLASVGEALAPLLSGQILVSPVVPFDRASPGRVQRLVAGSAAEELQQMVMGSAHVVACLHTVSYELLREAPSTTPDTLVCGGGGEDKRVAIELCGLLGLRGLDAGPLENAVVLEGLTVILVGMNVALGINRAGICVTGI
jgi:8-hydroxy-5-deazaflavin:NADPH oxidoreductase